MLKKHNHILIILLGIIWLSGSATKTASACGGGSGAGGCRLLIDYCYDYDVDGYGYGYGNSTLSIVRCDDEVPPLGFVSDCNDPDDNNENITPGS